MSDPTLYLYTSLTAGSSHIVTATARLETILKANKLPFRAIDVATDDAARKLWGRRSKGKKLPGLVKYGTVVGDLEEIEEWNEYGELRMQVNSVEDIDSLPATSSSTAAAAEPTSTSTASTPTPSAEPAAPKQSTIKIQNPPAKEAQKDDSISVALRQAGEEAASKAKENATKTPTTSAAPAAASEEKQAEKTKDTVCHRLSVAPEIAESPVRPPLVPECAAESSANLRADNAEALGLIEHHRGSIVSATSPEEKSRVAQDLRKSISGGETGFMSSTPGEVGDTIEDVSEDEEEKK
jgi:hypothetical protein